MGLFERARPSASLENDPIDHATESGVSLACFVEVCRASSDRGLVREQDTVSVAAEFGVGPDDWNRAVVGWNSRLRDDVDAAKRFSALWRGGGGRWGP